MSWRKVVFPPSVIPLHPPEEPYPVRLVRLTAHEYKEAAQPKGFCVFSAYVENLFTVYFSPVAAARCVELLDELGATQCDSPPLDLSRLTLEVGLPSDCQDLLKVSSGTDSGGAT